MPPSTLVRWCRFNVVGGIGIVVQFAALFLLKSVLHLNYLAATAIAVEAAVVHNFVWHDRFTWRERTKRGGVHPHTPGAERFAEKLDFGWRSAFSAAIKPFFSLQASAAGASAVSYSENCETRNSLRGIFAALKRCATQRQATREPAAQKPYGASWRRLVRFNLANGAVSIVGNLALMKVLVGQGRMNYLAANTIAITLCSLANFLVSETWVFERE
jgi:putative flippase GtrA